MPRHEPLAEGWGWLDALVGQLDEDFVEAVVQQPSPQECPKLDSLFPSGDTSLSATPPEVMLKR
jgi:hypothetical protein